MTSAATIDPAALPAIPFDERQALPDVAAIYFVLAGDTVLYIGQSVNLRQRWAAHHRLAQLNERGGCRIAWFTVDDAGLLNELERACIAHFNPPLNRSAVLYDECTLSVRIPRDIEPRLRQVAQRRVVSLPILLRQFIVERLEQVEREERAVKERSYVRRTYAKPFVYRGPLGQRSRCYLQVYEGGPGTLPVVIATELPHNAGMSITSAAEQVASQAWRELLPHAQEGPRYFEHCPTHGTDAATLLQHADVAMYVAKRGQLGHAVYDPSVDGHDGADLALVADLRQALATDGLVLHYQPKVTVQGGQICEVEALVRWPHPERGLIPPDRFIGVAEQTGLIVPLTHWVLEAALRQSQAWREAGLDLEMAVNLSLRNLRDPQFCGTVAALLARYAVPPTRLCLELTESVVMADVEGTQARVAELAALGVRLAIDDFGTGYSSLAYLSRLPVNELKIDRSFVQHATDTTADATIVASTIGLGHSLGMTIVTEGVEDAETWGLLHRLGSDVAQEYFLARPLPAHDLEAWVRRASQETRQASA